MLTAQIYALAAQKCALESRAGFISTSNLFETNLNMFDSAEFNIAMARHIKAKAKETCCECASISSQTLRDFWEALTSVLDGSFKKVSMVDIL